MIKYKQAEVVITGYRKVEFGWTIGIEKVVNIPPVGIEVGRSKAEDIFAEKGINTGK